MRLSNATISALPCEIIKPGYQRDQIEAGIVHLGLGAFHRCHMAVYTDDVMGQQGGDWKIIGVSLRGNAISEQLNPQNGLYTVEVKDSDHIQRRLIGSVDHVLFAPADPSAVIDALASDKTKIISLTVTEKGYCHDPATGALNESHPDIVHDLANPQQPKSAIGYIVAGLKLRKDNNAGPVTVLSCDNLPNNGATLKGIVKRYAQLVDPDLNEWISSNVRFPSSMVDRIVPAMEANAIQEFADQTGVSDLAVLQTEPFTQWVIEDNFATERPQWEDFGVQLVSDVEPYEETKLRMLNGSHSALAYLGFLAGFDFIDQAMSQPDLRRFVDTFMREEAPTSLTIPQGLDIDEYRLSLQQRYDNSALKHRTYQIAMDGSQKIPQRILGTLRHHLLNDGPIRACSLAIAAWMRYVMAVDESGHDYEVQDPLASQLKQVAIDADNNVDELVDGYLAIKEIFADDLIDNVRFKSEVSYWLGSILDDGVLATVSKFP